MKVSCFCLDDKSWVLESVINTFCISLKWLRTTLFPEMSYSELDELAESSLPGSNGIMFYPRMEGAASPFWRNDIKGFIYGLTLLSRKQYIVRSLMEEIGFQIKVNLDIHEELNKTGTGLISYFGGVLWQDMYRWELLEHSHYRWMKNYLLKILFPK